MKNTNESYDSAIPAGVLAFSWILILAGVFFFYVCTFKPDLIFHNVGLAGHSSKMGFLRTGVRILVSVIALVISVLANNPRWLLITLTSSVFMGLGDVIISLLLDGPAANASSLIVLTIAEIQGTLILWNIIKKTS